MGNLFATSSSSPLRRKLMLLGGGGAAAGLTILASSLGGDGSGNGDVGSGDGGSSVDLDAPVQAASIVDAHLHIWSDGKAPYPWAEGHEPGRPISEPSLGDDRATAEALLDHMDRAVVAGALIVQPITHKFDHSYVRDAIQKYPARFKGMCLANPTIEGGAEQAGELRLLDSAFL